MTVREVSPAPAIKHVERSGGVLVLIGAFKLFKAVVLLLLGLSALRLVHRDVAQQLDTWFTEFRVDPHSRFLHAAISKLGLIDDRKLREIGFGSFFYAGLLAIEGTGLLLRKRWAEYFTVLMTASFLPLEIFEIHRRLTGARVALLAINLAILAYLIYALRRDRRSARPGPS